MTNTSKRTLVRRDLLRAASGLLGAALAAPAVAGANRRIRLGIIGAGARGQELIQFAQSAPDTELAAIADIYTGRIAEAKRLAPDATTAMDYRRLLDDRSLDGILIATPQHLHAEHFVASIEAGKHAYQEKTMAFTVDHAKKMRAAYRNAPDRVVQVGHHWLSFAQTADVRRYTAGGSLGKITAIDALMYRNTPHGHPQWSRAVTPDMTEENILWKSFLGGAPQRPFDANRYLNWRFFWDYSGGNFYENMSHQVAFWYRLLDLKIPTAVTSTGGLYLWKDGREVPDTMSTNMRQPEELLFSWNSGFGNGHLGVGEYVLGTDGTIYHDQQQVRYLPETLNRPDAKPLVATPSADKVAHVKNFVDCIRDGGEPNCPFETGFRVSIACRMAVDSYRTGRTLRWDADKEEIVLG